MATLVYEGPPALIQDLQRTVDHGDEFDVPKDIASKLLLVHGFREQSGSKASAKGGD